MVALIHQQYVPLFRHCAELDAVVPFHGGYSRFLGTLRALRNLQPDLALVLHGNEPQATPLAYLAGARCIVKLPNSNEFRFLLANRETPSNWQQFAHALDQRLGEAALVGADIAGARMSLPAVPGAQDEVDAFLAATGLPGKKLLGLQCGASSRSRMWPAQHFIELGRRLLARHPDAGLVLTGAPSEAAYLDTIAAGIGGAVANAARGISLAALPALVGRFRLLVTGDTGTMHVAIAVGIPIVGLFAVSTPSASGPACDLERHVIIHQPCEDRFVRSKSDDQTCIGRIAVDTVFAAVQSVLERP
jgi:ADP-heptose:LPS heptosyltransferase